MEGRTYGCSGGEVKEEMKYEDDVEEAEMRNRGELLKTVKVVTVTNVMIVATEHV